MSQAGEVAGHAAQICIGALTFASGAAGALPTISVSLAALAALGVSRRLQSQRNSGTAAIRETLAALERSTDFTEDDLRRAGALLDVSNRRVKLDPEALRNGVAGGMDAFDRRLAEHLALAIPFEPGDDAARAAIVLALATAFRTCRRDPEIHRDLTQALLIESARASGIQIERLGALGAQVEEGFATVREMLRALQAQAEQVRIFENVLDFVVHEGGEFRLEISVMKDGKVCFFHNKPFRTDIDRILFFLEDTRVVFVSAGGSFRDLGFTLKESIQAHIRTQSRILLIHLDGDGAAKEGFYIPLKVYD